MKNLVTLLIVLICNCQLNAQILTQTTTPNGSTVWGQSTTELSNWECDLWTKEVSVDYPNAHIIRDANGRYNCGGFAWHMSNSAGASDSEKIWINPSDWWWYKPTDVGGDGSYAHSATECDGCKAEYWADDHVAVVQQIYGGGIIYLSKWGQGPLMRHERWDTPYLYPNTIRWFYRSGYGGNILSAYKDVDSYENLVWEVNTDISDLKGFNIYSKSDKDLKRLNPLLIERMDFEEIYKEGEIYKYHVSKIENIEYVLEIVYFDGTKKRVDFKNE